MMDINYSAKQKIQHALIELLNEKSFTLITVTDIIKHAKVNRSSYYYHYYLKEEILDDILDCCIQQLIEAIRHSNRRFSEITINHEILPSSTSLFNFIYSHKTYYATLLNSDKSLLFQTKFIEVLSNYFSNSFNPVSSIHYGLPVDIALQSHFNAFGIWGLILQWHAENYKTSPVEMSDKLTRLLFYKMDKVEILQ